MENENIPPVVGDEIQRSSEERRGPDLGGDLISKGRLTRYGRVSHPPERFGHGK